jgi:hypothetical protein
MPRKKRQGRTTGNSRRERRRAALGTVPPAAAVTPASTAVVTPAVAPVPAPAAPRRRLGAWLLVAAGLVVIAAVVGAVVLNGRTGDVAASPSPSIIVGTAGGFVTSQGDPSAAPTAEPSSPSAAPTEVPVATPPPVATQAPTAPVIVAATPPPAPTAAPSAASPQPTTIAVAVAGPDDTVAAFYARVVDGEFDAAYSLWSERMRAAYPRPENLDQRFDETAGIEFQQLFVAEQAGDRATVQANFTETYDSGASRQFIGYWRLIRVDGRWLLDEPTY